MFIWGVLESLYVSVSDYDRGSSLLENLYLDPFGWLHELWALWVGVGLMIYFLFRAELWTQDIVEVRTYKIRKK